MLPHEQESTHSVERGWSGPPLSKTMGTCFVRSWDGKYNLLVMSEDDAHSAKDVAMLRCNAVGQAVAKRQ